MKKLRFIFIILSLIIIFTAAVVVGVNVPDVRTFHASRFITKLENGEKATIVFLSDSTTEQNETTGGNPNHVGLVKTWLDELYPGQTIVVNAGIGGQTVEQMWARLYKDVLIRRPDMVVICSGINDYGGAFAIPLSKYEEIYSLMIQEIISQSDCDIIIRTPNPTLDNGFNNGMEKYNEAAYRISLKYHLGFFDLYSEMQKDANGRNINLKDLMDDAVHPNASGHLYIFEKFKIFFNPTAYVVRPVAGYKTLSGNYGFRLLESGAIIGSGNMHMNGRYIAYDIPKSRIEFEFTGTEFSIIYTGGPGTGQFATYIDGVTKPVTDTYRKSLQYRQYISYKVHNGKHTIQIECQSDKNAASSGTMILIDGVICK